MNEILDGSSIKPMTTSSHPGGAGDRPDRNQQIWLPSLGPLESSLLERALASSRNGIVLANAQEDDMPLIMVNPAFEQMTGYAADECLGRNCRFLQGEETDQVGLQELRTAIRNQQSCNVRLRNFRKDGSLFWNELFIAPVFDLDGRLTHYIGVQNDITSEVELAEALQTANDSLERSNAVIRSIFGRYVTDEVADVVLKSPESLTLGGEIRHVTLLMCDIRGYTTLTQNLSPHEVVELLNEFLGPIIDLIGEYGGTVDQILGDGILAIFGAPEELPRPSHAALKCALALQRKVKSLNQSAQIDGASKVSFGIGINSGPVVVGNIGSINRMKYSVIGSAVNLVARIESECPGGKILVSSSVAEEIGPDLRSGGRRSVKVKGFDEPITVFEATGLKT